MEEFNKNKDIDSNRGHFELVKLCKNLDSEEKLFFILLSTHFDNNQTAQDF